MVTRKSTKDSAVLRGTQEIYDGDDGADGGSGPLKTVDMSFISNVTSFVDGSGVGHVKVNDSMDWSEILRNDTTVHIVYEGSGSNKEILIFPVNETTSGSTDLSSTGSSGSDSTSGSGTVSPVDSLPTSSSGDSSSGGSEGVVGTGSTPTTLVIVASILAVIAIAAVFAVVMYGRRNRRRAFSEDPSNPDEPFIVGSLPHQPAPQLSMLDTDMTPDLWVEGQYQYSPNESGLQNSLNGTAILSDNNTTPSHHRLTVDAYPFGPNTRRGHREDGSRPRDNTYRSRREDGSRPRDDTYRSRRGNITPPLDDISERGRHRRGTTPVVLFEQDSIEEHNTNSSRKYPRQPSLQHQPRQPSQQRQQSQRGPSQQRRAHRDKYATRRDR